MVSLFAYKIDHDISKTSSLSVEHNVIVEIFTKEDLLRHLLANCLNFMAHLFSILKVLTLNAVIKPRKEPLTVFAEKLLAFLLLTTWLLCNLNTMLILISSSYISNSALSFAHQVKYVLEGSSFSQSCNTLLITVLFSTNLAHTSRQIF